MASTPPSSPPSPAAIPLPLPAAPVPVPPLLSPPQDPDIWVSIAMHLDRASIETLAQAWPWFQESVLPREDLYRGLILRELHLSDPNNAIVAVNWRQFYESPTYVAANDGSHVFDHFLQELHLGWVRMGGVYFNDGSVFVTTRQFTKEVMINQIRDGNQAILKIDNIKSGFWLIDFHCAQCLGAMSGYPNCEELYTVYSLRHVDLFAMEGFEDWEYEFLHMDTHQRMTKRSCLILEANFLHHPTSSRLFTGDDWAKEESHSLSFNCLAHGFASETPLRVVDDGYVFEAGFLVMRDDEERVVSILVTHLLCHDCSTGDILAPAIED